MDDKTTIADLKEKTMLFCRARDWEQFNNPKDLAINLITEAAELLDHFRYKTTEELPQVVKEKREHIEDELADVFFLASEFARRTDIDVATAFDNKLKKMAKNYPIERSKGINKKYDEYT